jgi:hAT family C-terminal dimerisation region
LFNTWHICLFNSKGSSANNIVSDTRADLKDFIRVKKISEPIKSEIDDYLADALDEASLDDDFDILVWWKLKASKYPVLARLTRDILAVPISTVASESTFSTSGRTLNPVLAVPISCSCWVVVVVVIFAVIFIGLLLL